MNALNRLILFISLILLSVASFASDIDDIRASIPSMSDAERIKAYDAIYNLSLVTEDTAFQVHCIYDMINEARRQGNVGEEAISRMTLISFFYNYDLNDSLYAHAHEQMDFMREHKLWETYYEVWTFLVNAQLLTILIE